MRDEVLQLMVWCIGTKKFSAEQIAEARYDLNTREDGQLLNSVALQDSLLALYHQYLRARPSTSLGLMFHRHRLVFHPEYMPLSSKSPDLHQPVEHFVGVLKGKSAVAAA
jgi:hypothetical protein